VWLCVKYTLAAMGAWMLAGLYAERLHWSFWEAIFRR
jgi:hypothetical protein